MSNIDVWKNNTETSYFDLGNKAIPDDVECSLWSLCKEIASSEGKADDSDSVNRIYKKFQNRDKSGVIDHLRKKLNFDVDMYDEFQMLQFLKLMYKYEKELRVEEEIPITEILSRPRVETVKLPYYAFDNVNGDNIERLQGELEGAIGEKKAKDRKKILIYLYEQWGSIMDSISERSYLENILRDHENLENIKNELSDIENSLKGIYNKLESPVKYGASDNIFLDFYTILINYKFLCEGTDRALSYEVMKTYIGAAADNNYATLFTECENEYLTEQLQTDILEKLISDGKCTYYINKKYETDMKYLIFRKNGELDKDDINALKLAKKNLEVLRKWFRDQKIKVLSEAQLSTPGVISMLESLPTNALVTSTFIAIIQAVVFCKKNPIKIKNDIHGLKDKEKRTLTAVLKTPNSAKHIQAWMIIIEACYSMDIGGIELLEKVRSIESIFTKVRKWMLQYHDLTDILLVNNALYPIIRRITTVPRYIAYKKIDELKEKIKNYGNIQNVYTCDIDEAKLIDLGRELQMSKGLIESIVNDVLIKKENVDKLTAKYGLKNYITQYNGKKCIFKYELDNKGNIKILNFYMTNINMSIYQIKNYGLGKLSGTLKNDAIYK